MDTGQVVSSLLVWLIIGLILGWLITEVLELRERVKSLEKDKEAKDRLEQPEGKENH